MNRVAVFVDAGYLFAQGSVLLSGSKLGRTAIRLDHERLLRMLSDFATQIAGVPLLRVYWYDGAFTGPNRQQVTLAHCANVKLRLGIVNRVGEQKGVDSLIVTDMIELARNRAMSDAVLLTGDEDLRIGVLQAQEFGVRVHLVGLAPSRGSQSVPLLQEADTTHEWTEADVTSFLRCERSPSFASASLAADVLPRVTRETLELLARETADAIEGERLPSVLETFTLVRQLPRSIDRRLLKRGRNRMGVALDSNAKKALRGAFVTCCRQRLAELGQPTGV